MKKYFHVRNIYYLVLMISAFGSFLFSFLFSVPLLLGNDAEGFYGISIFLLIIGVLSCYLFASGRKKQKSKAESYFSFFRCDSFIPDVEAHFWELGKYVGIDTKNRTMLLVSIYSKDKIVKSVSLKSWRSYECRGNEVILKFDDFSCPTFTIHLKNEKESMCFCNKLDVVLSLVDNIGIDNSHEFSKVVQERVQFA